VHKRSPQEEIINALGSLPLGNTRRQLIERILKDPTLAFNILYRCADLFTPPEQLMLCWRALDCIVNRPGEERSVQRANVLLGISWMLSHELRRQLVDFIATRASEALKLIRTPPQGMTLSGVERYKLIESIRACPRTSSRAIHSASDAHKGVALSQSEILLLARSALSTGERSRLLRVLRDRELLHRRTIRQLAETA